MIEKLKKINDEIKSGKHVEEIVVVTLILVATIVGFTIYKSRAIFDGTIEKRNAITIKAGLITFDVTSTNGSYDSSGKQITVNANKEIELPLKITNTTPIAAKYRLYYKPISPSTLPDGTVIAVSASTEENYDTGVLEKDADEQKTVVIRNTGASDITIELGVDGGYSYNPLDLANGHNQLSFEKAKEKALLAQMIKDNNSPISEEKPDFSTTATTDEGLIKDEDDDGPTYYFRGAVEDNYVKFRGLTWATSDSSYHSVGDDMLWRIVRINGDGTIRLVADGSIGTSAFNKSYSNEKYVGYTYDNSKANVQDGTDSTIKTYLEDWYEKNMMDYDQYIETSKFCNDTTVASTSGSTIYYGARGRLYTNKEPSFKCPNTTKNYGGLYTDLKVGLITADEVAFAGGKYNTSNSSYYLAGRTSSYFWTASPYYFNSYAYVWDVFSTGYVDFDYVGDARAVLPAVNLKSDLLVTEATGTIDDPYVVG